MSLLPPQLLEYVRKNPSCLVTVSSKRGLVFCPRRFRYTLEDEPPVSKNMKSGSDIHAQLAGLYAGFWDKDSGKRLLEDFVRYWEYLIPVLPPEQPFLVKYVCRGETYVVGGVIDLAVSDDQNQLWVLDHKVSTGWVLSAMPALASQEQLAIYSWALEKYGFRVAGGIISQIFYIPDPNAVYASAMATAEGIKEKLRGSASWGILTRNKLSSRAILHNGIDTLHIERRHYPLNSYTKESSITDLIETWNGLRDKSIRITGKHCEYCPFHTRCAEEYEAGIPPPPIRADRLHHEFFSRCP